MTPQSLGTRLRKAREAKGLTQSQLAELVDATYVQVSQWESGKHAPSSRRLDQLAAALGTTSSQLLNGIDKNAVPEPPAGLEHLGRYVREGEGHFRWIPSDPSPITEEQRQQMLQQMSALDLIERELVRRGATDEEADFVRSRALRYFHDVIHSPVKKKPQFDLSEEWGLYLEAVLKRLILERIKARDETPDPAPPFYGEAPPPPRNAAEKNIRQGKPPARKASGGKPAK